MIAQHNALRPQKLSTEPSRHYGRLSKEQLFEQEAVPHFPLLLWTAKKVTGDFAAAEDVVQEVCLQAWISFAAYTPGTNCRAWLFKILFYKLRKRGRQPAIRLLCLEDLAEEDQPTVTPLPAVLNEDRECLQDALQTLALPFREVVQLALVEEYSYREIAAQLNIPIGTVMSRLSRGRAMMKELLTH